MINQSLTGELIHCRVQSRTIIEMPVSCVKFGMIIHRIIENITLYNVLALTLSCHCRGVSVLHDRARFLDTVATTLHGLLY